MKKICFIVSSPATAKAFLERHIETLSEYYEIYLVANQIDSLLQNYANPNLKEIKHIKILRNVSIINDVMALLSLTKYLRHNKFDLVISFTPKAGLIGMLAAFLAGTKRRVHFFTGQVWHTKSGLQRKALILIDKLVVKLTTAILLDSFPQQQFLIDNGILSNENSQVLGKGTISGIDAEKFKPDALKRHEMRNKFGFTDEDFVVLFLGRLNTDKGVYDLLEAYYDLHNLYPNSKLVFAGPDEERVQQKYLNSGMVSKSINFIGPVDNPQDIFLMADVFCLPSHREAFGLSVLEASACGIPVICSDTYGLLDTMLDYKTGLRHETGNIESLKNALIILRKDPNLRITLGQNGKDFVKDHFSQKILIELWKEFIFAILQDKNTHSAQKKIRK